MTKNWKATLTTRRETTLFSCYVIDFPAKKCKRPPLCFVVAELPRLTSVKKMLRLKLSEFSRCTQPPWDLCEGASGGLFTNVSFTDRATSLIPQDDLKITLSIQATARQHRMSTGVLTRHGPGAQSWIQSTSHFKISCWTSAVFIGHETLEPLPKCDVTRSTSAPELWIEKGCELSVHRLH